MASLGIFEKDLEEKFVKGSGKGGQKINKTNSCVFLSHPISGLEVKCQRTRSLQENRFFARRLLCDKIENLNTETKSKEQQRIEKIRRQKRKRSKRAKDKMLDQKKAHSAKKNLRKKPIADDS